jgi:hypothetical protein
MLKIVNVSQKHMKFLAMDATSIVANFCDKFSVIVRDEYNGSINLSEYLKSLSPFLIKEERTSTWAGNGLGDQIATIRIYKVCEQTLALLNKPVSLFDFVEPMYPEDVCFYREDGSTFLITSAEEQDLYFTLEDHEIAFLKQHYGNIELNDCAGGGIEIEASGDDDEIEIIG